MNVASEIDHGHEQPRQNRTIQAHRPSPSPQLEERGGGDVFGIMRRLEEAPSASVHAIAMKIEESAKRIAVVMTSEFPQAALRVFRLSHT